MLLHNDMISFREVTESRQTLRKVSSAKQPLRKAAIAKLLKKDKYADPLTAAVSYGVELMLECSMCHSS